MRVLYGVVGEGMGHATRSRVVIGHLLEAGHEVKVVVSGRAHDFLSGKLGQHPRLSIEEIHGLHFVYEGNEIDRSETLWSNLDQAPEGLRHNLRVYGAVLHSFDAEVVISDFESWAYFYGKAEDLPVISIDNMQVINRCRHGPDITDRRGFDFRLTKLAVKAKLPNAYHYLITSFFFPPVRKRRTTLLPPILRPEILAARREPGEHVLVYQTAASNEALLPTLATLPYRFKVYGLGREGVRGNVELCAFSETGFVDDLRTARAVIAGGGFSLMGEAVHLHVPMLSVPLEDQYEQELNARYLAKLGYGAWFREIDADRIVSFLDHVDDYSEALESYPGWDNAMVLTCVDELLRHVELHEPAPNSLASPSVGDSVLDVE